ncbi:N-formylglutamate amidohydrolase [Roseicitreum antarcticum]|uniref:Predicted N-formylglutamate amidohydrolase n=1 Tax=Roseicitreum antarcticum TaxID=564137 RepID=A0A1H2UM54_9RHOB|nr:N-formylglutamate amidohydrolase [Roseicitreum antarcticum]SDW57192.1 Predicted N-formylglutamate amidohydrolase [Roseicitreum antarcticum]
MTQTAQMHDAPGGRWPGLVSHERDTNAAEGSAGLILVCEHASNRFAAPWGELGLTEAERQAHIAWDPGALGLARGLAARLGAMLIHAPLSRLIVDCNRAPDHPGAMPARSEVYDIPGNAAIGAQARQDRIAAIYTPFHATLHDAVARQLARGLRPALISVHSFTPVFHGKRRTLEFGVIHDADPTLAQAIVAGADAMTTLRSALNAPYSAADDVTHTLRLHATPYGLPSAMLEVRNDLIATPATQDVMARTLAPVLAHALLESGAQSAPAKAGAR